MALFKSLLVALSTYSVIPVPQFEWDEENMKYAICFLPVVGVLCALLLWGWYALCRALSIGEVFFSAVCVCIPILISGGIHMDGFMDTVDALSSHQSRERKLEILKDPHSGAFAVIYCIVYFLLSFGLYTELYRTQAVWAMLPVYTLSRSLSALCAVNIENARGSGMLCAYTKNAERAKVTAAMIALSLICAAVMVILRPLAGACAAVMGMVSVCVYLHIAVKKFGGATGDTAGFMLSLCELFCLAGAVIGAVI